MSGQHGIHPDDYPSAHELALADQDWQRRSEEIFRDRRKEMIEHPEPYDPKEPF